MSRAKLLLVAGFAVLAFSALSVSTASAAWDVNGTLLVGTAALANTASVLSFGELSSAELQIKCTGPEVLIKNGFIRHPDEVIAEDLTFHGCATTGESAKNCSLSSTLILTLPIHGLAELDGALNTLVKILPLPSKTFTIIKVTGELCAASGTQPINGSVDLLVDRGVHPEVAHLVLAFSLPGSLKLGSGEATLKELDADIRLASGLTWNFL